MAPSPFAVFLTHRDVLQIVLDELMSTHSHTLIQISSVVRQTTLSRQDYWHQHARRVTLIVEDLNARTLDRCLSQTGACVPTYLVLNFSQIPVHSAANLDVLERLLAEVERVVVWLTICLGQRSFLYSRLAGMISSLKFPWLDVVDITAATGELCMEFRKTSDLARIPHVRLSDGDVMALVPAHDFGMCVDFSGTSREQITMFSLDHVLSRTCHSDQDLRDLQGDYFQFPRTYCSLRRAATGMITAKTFDRLLYLRITSACWNGAGSCDLPQLKHLCLVLDVYEHWTGDEDDHNILMPKSHDMHLVCRALSSLALEARIVNQGTRTWDHSELYGGESDIEYDSADRSDDLPTEIEGEDDVVGRPSTTAINDFVQRNLELEPGQHIDLFLLSGVQMADWPLTRQSYDARALQWQTEGWLKDLVVAPRVRGVRMWFELMSV